MASATRQQLLALCRDVLEPLVRADDGKLYIVAVDDDSLALHLGGTCSGCPGAPYTIKSVIEPAVRAVAPSVRLVVTVGAKRPPGATDVLEALASSSGIAAAPDPEPASQEPTPSAPELAPSSS